ncbi:unnamed protein product [Lymnaea stagnalis]|uniref:Kinesin-like protein n=1 Tax=Lymnaea stagnalis TaxID=6523 RepID=A0AAV2IBQ5_LYMST
MRNGDSWTEGQNSLTTLTSSMTTGPTSLTAVPQTNKNKNSNKYVAGTKRNGVTKPFGYKLDPLELTNQSSYKTRSMPRSSDSIDSDRRVSFREDIEDHSDTSQASMDSDLKQTTDLPGQTQCRTANGGPEKGPQVSAKEPSNKFLDAARPGAMTWRKAASEPVLSGAGREDVDRFADDVNFDRTERFGSGNYGFDYEPTGRKYTAKPLRATFGSSTSLSTNTENSDDTDDVFNVILRVRPLNAQESSRRDTFSADFPGDGQVSINNSGTIRNFQFNVVFEPDADQQDVFESSGIKKLVEGALNGYSCTAFAFGQTGSGKTHTMTGPPAQFHTVGVTPDPNMYGVMQRSFKYLFQILKKQRTLKLVKASFLEVYNEQVIDLLNNSHRKYLTIRWSKNKGFYVENLFTVECETIDDLMAVLEEGLRNRQTGSHGLNEFSSRSHSVLTVTIDSETQPEPEDENLYITKRGKLSFVDLAGSEKVRDSTANGGPGMVESNSINKSLLVLGNCISHLCDPKKRQGHIPYRDSKLTKLLADSLGGNGLTLMIACITPSSSNVTETLNTLRYASRAKRIKTKPTIKMDPREKLIMTLKKEVKILRQENHYLRQQLDFPAKPRGQLQKENDEKFRKFMKEQHQKETGLYDMLQEYMIENEALRAENSEMHSVKENSRREQQILYKENEKLSGRLEELERLMAENPGTWSFGDHRRTDGYGQHDLSPVGSPVTAGYVTPSHRSTLRPIGATLIVNSSKLPSPVVHGQPMRPPHRLPDHVTRPAPRPVEYIEGNNQSNGPTSPRLSSLVKPGVISPRFTDRKSSQLSQTDVIRGMNEKLKQDLLELDGEIQHQTRIAAKNNNCR